MTASAVYEGWVRHRRFEPVEHAFRYRFFLMYLDLAELPGRARPLPALLGPAAARPRASAAPTSSATRRGRSTSAPATRSRPRPARRARPARSACSPACATSATPSTRSASTTASTPPASGSRLSSPRSRTSPGESATRTSWRGAIARAPVLSRRAREDAPRLAADGDGPDLRLPRQRARRAARRSTSSRGRRAERRPSDVPRAKTFDATLTLRRRELSRPLLLGLLARYPAMSLQVVAKIYAQSLRLKLKGARYFPHPEGRRPKGFVSP